MPSVNGKAGELLVSEEQNVRELFRACANFLDAVEADPALASRTRLAAAGVAAALQRVAGDWQVVAREWRQMRGACMEARAHMHGMDRRLGEIYALLEEEEWPTIP